MQPPPHSKETPNQGGAGEAGRGATPPISQKRRRRRRRRRRHLFRSPLLKTDSTHTASHGLLGMWVDRHDVHKSPAGWQPERELLAFATENQSRLRFKS